MNAKLAVCVATVATLLVASASNAALVAHYKFDDGSGSTALDSAGGDQNATTNQGTVGWTTGIIGGALDLPGNASMQVADAIGVGATAYTISAWVNMDDTPGYDGIYAARDTENLGLNVEGGSAANLHFDFRYDNPPIAGGGSQGVDSPDGSAVVGTWHHIATTWTADHTFLDIYVDGADVGDANTTVDTVYNGHLSTWNIGDDPCCGGRELNAQLDDLAVWDEALSPLQISFLHNGGLRGLDAPQALAAGIPEPASGILALVGLAA